MQNIKERASESINFRELKRYRLERIQLRLQAAQIPAVLLFEPQNIRYATNLTNANLLWTFYTPVRYAFVPVHGLPIMFEYALDTCPVSASDLEFVADVRPAISLATFYKLDQKTKPTEDWCDALEALMDEHCEGERRIAIDSLPPAVAAALCQRGFDVHDGDGLMMHARLIKSSEEVKCLEAAVAVADEGGRQIRKRLKPGMTEQYLWSALHEANVEHGGEWIETRLLTSGERTNPWYQSASEHRVADGDLVVFDTDLVGPFGYVGDISRAYLCGDQPTSEQKEAYRVAYDTLHHNLNLMRPGISFGEIAERCFIPPEPYRATQEAVGHGAGVQIEFPLLCTKEETHKMPDLDMTLDKGMSLCIEAYAGKVGGREGVKLEQQLVITSDGSRALSKLPFEDMLLN